VYDVYALVYHGSFSPPSGPRVDKTSSNSIIDSLMDIPGIQHWLVDPILRIDAMIRLLSRYLLRLMPVLQIENIRCRQGEILAIPVMVMSALRTFPQAVIVSELRGHMPRIFVSCFRMQMKSPGVCWID
jgi:hypothetical protein